MYTPENTKFPNSNTATSGWSTDKDQFLFSKLSVRYFVTEILFRWEYGAAIG